MADRTIQKAKAGVEDLLFGDGTVAQTRNATNIDITKINADKIPYSGDATTADVVTVKEQIDTNSNNYAYNIDSIADLIAITSANRLLRANIQVAGFSSAGDGGGGLFYWSATTDADTHNGGTIIDPSIGVVPGAATWWTPRVTTDTGVWIRTESKIVDVMVFGGIEGIVAGISTNSITGVVSTEQTLAADLTVPSNITLNIKNTGQIDGAFTLTVNGNIEAGNYQLFGSSVSVILGTLCKDSIVPHWFDDSDTWNGVIRAINSMEAGTGGSLNFPSGVYSADTEVVISSYYPINLLSDMREVTAIGTVAYGSYITPATGISGSIFKYVAPDSGARNRHGAGLIQGLTFLDDSNLDDTDFIDRRTIAVTACLELEDFDFGTVDRCCFQYIKGSAIYTERMVQGNILNCVFRFSGDTAKPTIYMNSEALIEPYKNITQSTNIDNCKIESNYNAEYIHLSAETETIKITNCGFEALTNLITDPSCQKFIYSLSNTVTVGTCHFNKNAELEVHMTGTESIISDCSFLGNNTNGRILLTGTRSIISNVIIQGSVDNTGTAVTLGVDSVPGNGAFSTINNLSMRNGGNLVVHAQECQLSNINITDPITTESHIIKILGNRTCIYNSLIIGNEVDDVGGILLDGAYGKCDGLSVIDIGETAANAAHAIDTTAGTITVVNCTVTNLEGTTAEEIHIHNNTVVVANCNGLPTENSGLAVIAPPDTTSVVTHGLIDTPDVVLLTEQGGALENASHMWVTAVGATTFQINIDSAPTAVDDRIYWYAKRVNV